MRARFGVVSGSLALIGLQVLLTADTRTGASGRIGELFALPAAWARRLIDPSIPAIPDLSAAASPAPSVAPAPAPAPTAPPKPGGAVST